MNFLLSRRVLPTIIWGRKNANIATLISHKYPRIQKNKNRSQSLEGRLSAKPVLITMEALFVFQTKLKPD